MHLKRWLMNKGSARSSRIVDRYGRQVKVGTHATFANADNNTKIIANGGSGCNSSKNVSRHVFAQYALHWNVAFYKKIPPNQHLERCN
jgi:hypothetical protein